MKGTEPHIILGWDISGVVTEVGKNATKSKWVNFKFIGQPNAYAEYVSAPENQLVLKPANVSFEASAESTSLSLIL